MTEPAERPTGDAVAQAVPYLAGLAVIVAAVVAALTVHPLVGAALPVVAFGGAWVTLTRRAHDREVRVAAALARAQAQAPLNRTFEQPAGSSAFEAARPSAPAAAASWKPEGRS